MKKLIGMSMLLTMFMSCEKKVIYPDDIKAQARADSLEIIKQDSLDNVNDSIDYVNDSLNAIQMRELNKFKSGSQEVYYFPLEGFTHSLEVFMNTHTDLEYIDAIPIYNAVESGGGLKFMYAEGYTVIFRKRQTEKQIKN